MYHEHLVLRVRSCSLDNAGILQPTDIEAAAKIAETGNKTICIMMHSENNNKSKPNIVLDDGTGKFYS